MNNTHSDDFAFSLSALLHHKSSSQAQNYGYQMVEAEKLRHVGCSIDWSLFAHDQIQQYFQPIIWMI